MNKKPEPHKHHFIPQFILKNFADSEKQLYHWDNENKLLIKKSISEVFMENDMYRDEKQNQENPTAIEERFSVFERRIAMLIQNKIINESIIRITKKENEELRIFLTLLSLRSKYRKEQYTNNNFDDETRKELSNYQCDNDFESLWKRELNLLVNIRNYDKIRKNTEIDFAIKTELLEDYDNYYMSFIETDDEHFLITDVNPTNEVFPLNPYCAMHYLFPLSPKRMLLLSRVEFSKQGDNGLNLLFKQYSKINPLLYETSGRTNDSSKENNAYEYEVKKCKKEDVIYINCLLLNEVRKEMAFLDSRSIKDSLQIYGKISNVKNNYEKLEKEI